MEPLREISEEEYKTLNTEFIQWAKDLQKYHKSVLKWTNILYSHFYSDCSVPCRYDHPLLGYGYTNPKTGRELRGRKLPDKYNIGSLFPQINHFSPAGCPSLKPFYSVVHCLAGIGEKYFYCQHRVGECPHKKAKD